MNEFNFQHYSNKLADIIKTDKSYLEFETLDHNIIEYLNQIKILFYKRTDK